MAGEHWKSVWERFDPLDPELPAARGWVAERPRGVLWDLDRKLARPVGERRYLVHGTVGTGKTTELLRLLGRHDADYLGVYFNVHHHFAETVRDTHALRQVEPWELVFLVGLAVVRAAEERLGHRWDPAQLQRLGELHAKLTGAAEGAPPEVDIAKLARALAVIVSAAADAASGVVASGLAALTGVVRWSLPIGLGRGSGRPDQDRAVQGMLDAVNSLIGAVQATYRPILVVLDGLDRLAGDRDALERLLVQSGLLGRLVFRASVLTGPVTVRRRGYAPRIHAFESVPLTNVPVLSQADPSQPGPGIPFFERLYALRVAGLDQPEGCLPVPLLRRLAYCSGGLVREFVRFVREVADELWQEADVATEEVVERVIDRRRRTYEQGLDRGDLELLRGVASDPDHDLPARERDRVDQLLDRFALLPYPNESEWYYPHPLLMLGKLKRTPTG